MQAPILTQNLGLTLANLTLSKEKSYQSFVTLFAVLIWLGLTVGTLGIGLFYAALFGLFIWIGNGLLIAYLRSEAVLVNERQLPELHATFLKTCAKLGVSEIPRLYVLEAGGSLNAFATRFAGRDFVVVFADILEAFGPESDEIKFILGHELGHLKSRHLSKRLFLAPGMMVPLLGTAYLRACEASCDRHGAFAADELNSSLRAMLTLSGGKQHGKSLDPAAFADQHHLERGFFVSLHELTSGYPTLSQRVSNLLGLHDSQYNRPAARHALAYPFAFFSPGGGMAAGPNILIFVVIIGLFAAMAIPAFEKVRANSQGKACHNNKLLIQAAYDKYEIAKGKAPETYDDFINARYGLAAMPVCPDSGNYSVDRNEGGGCTVTCSAHP